VLETLQTGVFDADGFKVAREKLADSPLHVLHVSEDDQQLFFEFRREATFVEGEAAKIRDGQSQNKSDEIKKLWQTEKDNVSQLFQKLKTQMYTRLSD
jgi:hypothetical protein